MGWVNKEEKPREQRREDGRMDQGPPRPQAARLRTLVIICFVRASPLRAPPTRPGLFATRGESCSAGPRALADATRAADGGGGKK